MAGGNCFTVSLPRFFPFAGLLYLGSPVKNLRELELLEHVRSEKLIVVYFIETPDREPRSHHLEVIV